MQTIAKTDYNPIISGHHSHHNGLAVTLCVVALRVGVGVESRFVVFLIGRFLAILQTLLL